jgi:hypothetical protein
MAHWECQIMWRHSVSRLPRLDQEGLAESCDGLGRVTSISGRETSHSPGNLHEPTV